MHEGSRKVEGSNNIELHVVVIITYFEWAGKVGPVLVLELELELARRIAAEPLAPCAY